jgi:hypothetical protein
MYFAVVIFHFRFIPLCCFVCSAELLCLTFASVSEFKQYELLIQVSRNVLPYRVSITQWAFFFERELRRKSRTLSEISGSHGDEYEDDFFRRTLLPSRRVDP